MGLGMPVTSNGAVRTVNIEGRYANDFQVGHNAFEFVLDFGQQYGAGAPVQVHTRIITSPAYAKAFLQTLTLSIARYESEFGAIAVPDDDETQST